MKRILVPAALCLALAGPLAFAQQPQTSAQQPPAPVVRGDSPDGPVNGRAMARHFRHDPHHEAVMLSRRLNLTPDQTARIEPIFADREQKIKALRANNSLPPEELHRQMGEIRRQEHTQMLAVLTPEQQEQLKSMRHGRGQFRGPGQPPQGSPAGL